MPLIALELLFLLSALALSACVEDDFFMACPLSDSILESCHAESEATTLTCVVAQHPMCDEQICGMWRDSAPFCSKVCEADADCPTGSTCQPYLDFDFCVPDAVLTPTVTE